MFHFSDLAVSNMNETQLFFNKDGCRKSTIRWSNRDWSLIDNKWYHGNTSLWIDECFKFTEIHLMIGIHENKEPDIRIFASGTNTINAFKKLDIILSRIKGF